MPCPHLDGVAHVLEDGNQRVFEFGPLVVAVADRAGVDEFTQAVGGMVAGRGFDVPDDHDRSELDLVATHGRGQSVEYFLGCLVPFDDQGAQAADVAPV